MKSKSIQLYIRINLLTKYPIAQTFRQEEELLFLSKNISLPNAAQSIMSSGILQQVFRQGVLGIDLELSHLQLI